jgi:anti-anti-sigma factor
VATPAERSASRFHAGVEDLEQAVVVTVQGEVDAANVHAVRGALERAIEPARPNFVVDVRRVSYIDSLGITVLVQCFDRARAQGMGVAVICNERMAELLESLGLNAEVAIVRSRDQALAASPPPPPPAPPVGEPPYRATLRAARELVEQGAVPADEEELLLLRRALEDGPPRAGGG